MAKLVFRVSADYEEVVKLRNEIAKLKSELKGMDATRTPAALEALNDKLSSSTKRMNELVTVAANAGAAMEGDFKKELNDLAQLAPRLDLAMFPVDPRMGGDFMRGARQFLDRIPTQFSCNCSKERIEKALISVGKQELQEMIDDGKTIEVNCHFCNKHYPITVEELKVLLEKAR